MCPSRVCLQPHALEGCDGIAGLSTTASWWIGTGRNQYGTGLIWLDGNGAQMLPLWLHEAGHNMQMAHANTPGPCQQCDPTCTMGAPTAGQCFNAPHTWQVRGVAWRSGEWRRCGVDVDLSYLAARHMGEGTRYGTRLQVHFIGAKNSDRRADRRAMFMRSIARTVRATH